MQCRSRRQPLIKLSGDSSTSVPSARTCAVATRSCRPRSFSKRSLRTVTCVLTPWCPPSCPRPTNFSMMLRSPTRSAAAAPRSTNSAAETLSPTLAVGLCKQPGLCLKLTSLRETRSSSSLKIRWQPAPGSPDTPASRTPAPTCGRAQDGRQPTRVEQKLRVAAKKSWVNELTQRAVRPQEIRPPL